MWQWKNKWQSYLVFEQNYNIEFWANYQFVYALSISMEYGYAMLYESKIGPVKSPCAGRLGDEGRWCTGTGTGDGLGDSRGIIAPLYLGLRLNSSTFDPAVMG